MTGKRGFTLIELLVTIGIIALILAILIPSLSSMRERTLRASCANNMRQLHMNFLTIAADNNGELLKAYEVAPGRRDPLALSRDDSQALADVGLIQSLQNPDEVLKCPSSEEPLDWSDPTDEFIEIGFQYLGGVERWHNDFGEFAARSPVRAGQAQNGWVLFADRSTWDASLGHWSWLTHSGSGVPVTESAPGVDAGDVPVSRPDGQNQLYFDGSASWVDISEPVYVHSGADQVQLFIAQDDLGTYGRTVDEDSRTHMSTR